MDKNRNAFFALLKAGLWEQSVRLLPYEPLDFDSLYELADEQAVVGLIGAGLEHVEDRKVTKPEAVRFLKKVVSLESRNSEMNSFIEELTEWLRRAGVHALLIKGQGIAQCYARPQWRSSGDIDLLLDLENYEKAKTILSPKAKSVETEVSYNKHLGMTIGSWTVELHGSFRSGLSSRIDRTIDAIQADTFNNGEVRCWHNKETDVYLPSPDNDLVFVFTHILTHFFRGGIGLRQFCDWCRLLWSFRDVIDHSLLEKRLREMRLISEWKTFAAFAVDFLGMPVYAMPFYEQSSKWSKKALIIRSFVLEVGNFGQKRDLSYFKKYPYVVRKAISLHQRCCDLVRHASIFPLDSMRFFFRIVINGLTSAVRGE